MRKRWKISASLIAFLSYTSNAWCQTVGQAISAFGAIAEDERIDPKGLVGRLGGLVQIQETYKTEGKSGLAYMGLGSIVGWIMPGTALTRFAVSEAATRAGPHIVQEIVNNRQVQDAYKYVDGPRLVQQAAQNYAESYSELGGLYQNFHEEIGGLEGDTIAGDESDASSEPKKLKLWYIANFETNGNVSYTPDKTCFPLNLDNENWIDVFAQEDIELMSNEQSKCSILSVEMHSETTGSYRHECVSESAYCPDCVDITNSSPSGAGYGGKRSVLSTDTSVERISDDHFRVKSMDSMGVTNASDIMRCPL